MRGTVARRLRQMVNTIYQDRVDVDYEIKERTHGGIPLIHTTKTLTVDCKRHAYKGVKRQWKVA